MSEQPKALRLADELDAGENFYAESSISFDFKLSNAASEAAYELRRLHELNAELLAALNRIAKWNEHTTVFAIDYGSKGVRDFYRSIALEAIIKATGEQQ